MNLHWILRRLRQLAWLVLNALLLATAQAANPAQVLLLNSYHQGMDWTDGEIAGIKSSLDKQDLPVELHIEYMDAKRVLDRTHFDNLRQLYAHKYRAIPLSAIVVTDNDAFDFMREQRDALFPGVPVVFCGVNWFKNENLKGLSGFTGVAETVDSAGTLELMLRLHPDTKRIVVLLDSTTTGKALQRELEEVAKPFGARVRFEFWSALSTQELSASLAALSANDLVLLMPYASDRSGRFVSHTEVAKLVAEHSPVASYSNWDFYLGYGIVGGSLMTATAQGRAAGRMLSRILTGENANKIPVLQQLPAEYAFDARQLSRFHIRQSQLPANSTIYYLPWYEINQTVVWAAGLLALILIALVWMLLVSVARKRQVDSALRRNIDTLMLRDSALAEISQGVMITGADQRITYVNRALEEISGYRQEELLGRNFALLQGPQTSDLTRQQIVQAMNAHRSYHGEILNYRKDGSPFWNLMSISPVLDVQGQLTQFVGIQKDITDRKLAEVELSIAAKAFESQVAIVVTDAEGIILRVNQAFTQATGYSEAEAIGQKASLLSSGRHDQAFYQQLWAALKTQKFWQGVIWNRQKGGAIYAEWLTINAVVTPEGVISHFVGTFSDINQNEAAEAEVHRLAYYDQLTGFPNRRLLQDRLGQALASAERSAAYGAILFLDLDCFSTLNDTLGHAMGDLLLIQVAHRLRHVLRQSDTVARLGGDEFVVIVEDLDDDAQAAAATVKLVGNKIGVTLAQPYELNGCESNSTASVGICLFKGQETVEQLLKNAEIAMYQAKADGRNSLRFFDPAMQTVLDQRSVLENDLRQAINRKQLQLFYQAQVNHEGRTIGAEVLLRWKHPERHFISPMEFIPLAEQTGLILPIGRWVLQKACEQLKLWSDNDATRHLRVSVNVSSLQFRQDDFVEEVCAILKQTGIEPTRLKLELTESLILHDVENTIQKMQALKKFGVTFSMDDFGTGYSSLAYLTRLPLDELKIDKSFVANLPGTANDCVIAQTIITMGQSLGLVVVAEGVETQEQRTFLFDQGCHVYQGYLFAKPVPIDDFARMLPEAELA